MEIDDKSSKTIYPSKVNSKPVIAGDKAEQKLMADKFDKVIIASVLICIAMLLSLIT